MKVNVVDNMNFASKSDENTHSRMRRPRRRENIDELIALDDSTIKSAAYLKALHDTEDKKHSKLSKAILAFVPVVAGLKSAAFSSGKAKTLLTNKPIKGVAARMLHGGNSIFFWTAAILGAKTVFAAKDSLEEKSPVLNKFSQNNPVLSVLMTSAAGIGALFLGTKYSLKMFNSIIRHVNPASITKYESSLAKRADRFNKNSIVSGVADFARKIRDSKSFAPLKDIVAGALDIAPMFMLFGYGIHELTHSQVVRSQYMKNYSNMKNIQAKLAQARINELSKENTYLRNEIAENDDLQEESSNIVV